MPDSDTHKGMAIPLAAFATGGVVALLVGVFGKVHDPSLDGTTTLGFDTVIDMKVVVSTVIGVLAVLQVIGALCIYGKLGVKAPSWLGTAHRIGGTVVLVLTVFVAYHCLWALGLESGNLDRRREGANADGRARCPRLRCRWCHRGEGGRGSVEAGPWLVPAGSRWPALRPPRRRRPDLGRLVHRRGGLADLWRVRMTRSRSRCSRHSVVHVTEGGRVAISQTSGSPSGSRHDRPAADPDVQSVDRKMTWAASLSSTPRRCLQFSGRCTYRPWALGRHSRWLGRTA